MERHAELAFDRGPAGQVRVAIRRRELALLAGASALLIPLLLLVCGVASLPSILERGIAWLAPAQAHDGARGAPGARTPAHGVGSGVLGSAWMVTIDPLSGLRAGGGRSAAAITGAGRSNAATAVRVPRPVGVRSPVATSGSADVPQQPSTDVAGRGSGTSAPRTDPAAPAKPQRGSGIGGVVQQVAQAHVTATAAGVTLSGGVANGSATVSVALPATALGASPAAVSASLSAPAGTATVAASTALPVAQATATASVSAPAGTASVGAAVTAPAAKAAVTVAVGATTPSPATATASVAGASTTVSASPATTTVTTPVISVTVAPKLP